MGRPYLYMPVLEPLREEVLQWGLKHVSDGALDPEGGREDNPHITLAYGLPSNEDVVRRILDKAMVGRRSLKTSIRFATHFKNSKRSVLVLTCSSSPLQSITDDVCRAFRINYRLNAHITIAYLRTGREVGTSGLMGFVGRTVEADHLVFVDQDKTHYEVRF